MYSHLAISRRFVKRHGTLHVIVPCFNPTRFVSRYSLLMDFIKHATDAGAEVWVCEAAFGNRPFEVDYYDEAHTIRFRVIDEIWLKESMINATVAHLPPGWEYVAWVDGDVTFINPDWVQETIQQLQHFDVVQMFHDAIDMGPNSQQLATFKGFPASVLEGLGGGIPAKGNGDYYLLGYHPGFAWACRRHAWEVMGGLLDINIVGGGDFQMAYALFDQVKKALPDTGNSTEAYRKAVLAWQDNVRPLRKNVGFVPGTLVHHWHGKKSRRGYYNRWQILARNRFDPYTDLKRNSHGLWQLAGNKIKLRDDMRAYFRSRQEDGIDV